MKPQEFKTWVKRKLGQDDTCGIRVELTDNQIEQCLEDAKAWFNSYVGLYRESSFSMVESQSEYDLSAVTPKIDDVVKLWFPSQGYQIDFNVLYPGFLDINGIPYGTGAWWSKGSPQTTIVQTLQALESTAKVLSSELGWEFVQDFTVVPAICMVRIMPAPIVSGKCVYQYRVDPTTIKLEQYPQRYLWLIREWALAECKYTLGRIRGKYTGGLPAAGGDRQLDGDSLIQESIADKERITTMVLDFQGPVMPLIG